MTGIDIEFLRDVLLGWCSFICGSFGCTAATQWRIGLNAWVCTITSALACLGAILIFCFW